MVGVVVLLAQEDEIGRAQTVEKRRLAEPRAGLDLDDGTEVGVVAPVRFDPPLALAAATEQQEGAENNEVAHRQGSKVRVRVEEAAPLS